MRKVQLLHDLKKHSYYCPYFERVSRASGLRGFFSSSMSTVFATNAEQLFLW